MSGGLFLLALLPIFVTCDPSFDFRSVKYAERNGKCFVDVYQPSLQESEPLTNFFIRQTFKSECYPSFTKHGFNLIHNNKGGYHFVGCFYYNESQTIKCEEFNDNEFKQ
uniref:Uncharacterized protein n=1 Tax=Panagrolaimus sp. JU765 TaxID=591449 RepID=A0AC34Q0T5_9BILA